MSPRLLSLLEYPLKSAAGIRRESAEVLLHGLERDRRWLLMSDGAALSQRQEPRLALLRTRDDGGRIRVTFRGDEILLDERERGVEHSLELWGREVRGIDLGEESAEFFSRGLGKKLRVLYMPAPLIGSLAPGHATPGGRVGFADDFPLLLTSAASLEDLNRRMEVPLPMDRFRPNVVVNGFDPYEEDRWTRIGIGMMSFRVPKSCPRCRVTTIDQETASIGREPLVTLATYRKREEGVMFGRYLVPEAPGILHEGDEVRVLQSP